MTTDTKTVDRQWAAHNYRVSFIDLLGQRDAMRGQGLLRPFASEDERKAFDDILRNSIGAIIKLQDRAENILAPILKQNLDSSLRATLPPEKQAIWDDMLRTRIETQRWSDGLMSFVCLGRYRHKMPNERRIPNFWPCRHALFARFGYWSADSGCHRNRMGC